MCGIAGIVRISDKPLPHEDVAGRMIASIVHRGPDEWGDYRDPFVHICNVRLSVIDVENGRQPAVSGSGNSVAVYNGEVYNFRDLASELRGAGFELSNESDTVVLPNLYEKSGLDFVSQLRGMFSFALWDKIGKRLVLCRDRLGIKPLFFAKTNDYLLFGSEIKAIIASGLIEPEIDRDSLDDLFSLSYPCAPRTMFKNIFELRPAHWMCVYPERREIEQRRYWSIPFVEKGQHQRISLKDAGAEYRQRLQGVIKDHLMSDVGVGYYLSGGIDSSAVAAVAKEIVGESIDCFTITFAEKVHSEEEPASVMAKHLGANHWLVPCGKELAEGLPKMIYHQELPLQYPLGLPLQKLSQVTSESGHKVVLTGEGADEQLAGYDCFRMEQIRQLSNMFGLKWVKSLLYKRLFKWVGSPPGLDTFLLEKSTKSDREIEREFGGVRPAWFDVWRALDIDRELLLGVGGRRVRRIDQAPDGFCNLLPENLIQLDPLDSAIAIEMNTRLSSWALWVDDRTAMANGIETRVPFLDHELVEWVAKLPPAMKLKLSNEKLVLREAMRGLLPEQIRSRKKQSFYSPIKEWFFSSDSPEFVQQFLSKDAISATGYFDPDVVAKMLEQLKVVPHEHFLRFRLEWILMLVLGTQLLDHLFIKGADRLAHMDWQGQFYGMRSFRLN